MSTTAHRNGAELLVAALENEGVECIFAVPGEENLDVLEALRRSRIQLIVTRHEQPAAFMAATYGRLTGKPGVCLTTLGPGATNLTTGAAFARLGGMPMVMITGQKPIFSARQAQFQIVDIVATMRPLTKLSRQIVSTAMIPTLVRSAFREALEERPGPVHLELPEDIAAEPVGEVPLVPVHAMTLPVPADLALDRAAELILGAARPLIMIGAAANRVQLVPAVSEFVRRTQIPFFNTQMGKGAVDGNPDLYLGTAALSDRRLRARRDLRGRRDRVDRPRCGREAAVPDGAPRSACDPHRLHAGRRRGGVFSGARGDRRHRGRARTACGSTGRKAGSRHQLLPRATARDPRPRVERQRPPALSAHAPAHRPRRTRSDARRRHRLARQRHVQDLVRTRIPHACREHDPARQRARDHGRGPTGRDGGGVDLPRTAAYWWYAATAAL